MCFALHYEHRCMMFYICISRFFFLDPNRCSVLCKGTITTNVVANCVAFDISFKLNKTLTSKLKYFSCKIPNCLLERVEFECTFNKEYTETYFNESSNNKEDQITQHDTNGINGSSSMKEDQKYQQDTYGENRSCFGNLLSFAFYKEKHKLG